MRGSDLDGHPQGAGRCLEDRLADVVAVAAVVHDDVQVAQRSWRPTACQKSSTSSLSNSPILGEGNAALKDQIVAAAEIERRRDQRLLHRQREVAVAADAGFVAQGLPQRLAEANADVFDRVVLVDVQVALGLDRQVEQPRAWPTA